MYIGLKIILIGIVVVVFFSWLGKITYEFEKRVSRVFYRIGAVGLFAIPFGLIWWIVTA